MLKFGIVTPTYNRPELLKRCIESVKNQSYSNWLQVIVDDSEQVNGELIKLINEKHHYLKNSKNQGVCYSRNKGIEYLLENNVDFIVFLDDDDFFDKDTLKNALKEINEFKSFEWFVSRKIDHQSEKSLTQLNKLQGSYNYVDDYLIGKSIRRDTTHFLKANLLRRTNIRFNEKIRGGGEWRFFAALSEYVNFKFFEGGITFIEFQTHGLTHKNKNKKFIATERADLVVYLNNKKKFKLKQIEYGASVLKHFIKLNEYNLLNDFKIKFVNRQNFIIRILFRIEFLILKVFSRL